MNALSFPKSPASAVRDTQRATRLAGIIATIPASVRAHERLHAFCERYAQAATGLNKRRLARVVWPWLRRHEPVRPPYISLGRWRRIRQHSLPQVPRGRTSNPTVL